MIYVGLVAGIVFSIVTASLLGAPAIDVNDATVREYSPWLLTFVVMVAAMGMAVAQQTSMRLVLPTGLVSALGYLVYAGAVDIGLGANLAPAIAAVVLGFLARIIALSLRAPQLVVAVPASIFLLPGLMIFRAMYDIGANVDTMYNGAAGLVHASIIILAIAMGLVLGDALARPLTSGLKSNERRRSHQI